MAFFLRVHRCESLVLILWFPCSWMEVLIHIVIVQFILCVDIRIYHYWQLCCFLYTDVTLLDYGHGCYLQQIPGTVFCPWYWICCGFASFAKFFSVSNHNSCSANVVSEQSWSLSSSSFSLVLDVFLFLNSLTPLISLQLNLWNAVIVQQMYIRSSIL